jgi:hypothetical protein
MAGFFVQGEARFDLNGAALASMLNNPLGPVGIQLLASAGAILEIARAHCPVADEAYVARWHRERGRLRDSLHIEPIGGTPGYLIGSNLDYARRQEFTHPSQAGFLRGALAAVLGAHSIRGPIL